MRRRIDDGSLPEVLDHGRLMVRADDLLAYIDGLQRFGTARPRQIRPRSSAGGFEFLHE